MFGDETTGTTDGAEATEATQEPDSTGATQPTASGEEDTASGGPAVIFINVIKVFSGYWGSL